MARSKQSPLEDIIDIASKLPWRINCILAVVSFIVLHLVSGIVPEKLTGVGQMGAFAAKQIWITLAMFGQYVLPFAFLLGGLVSFIKEKKRDRLYTTAANDSGADALFNMNWQEFEMLVEEHFRRKGYTAIRTGGQGADGGVDIILKKGSETYLVQCKQWKAFSLGVKPVRELYGVMASMYAVGGFVVCSGKFTREAREFAQNINVELIDGTGLHRMIREARQLASQAGLSQLPVETLPTCPMCGERMVKRTARKGINTGKDFFGCSAYPRCKGMVALA